MDMCVGVSAQPQKPKRRPRKPAKHRKWEQSIALVVTPDGRFAPADAASKRICRDRKLYTGIELIAYVYEPRDVTQWRKAHALGNLLAAHLDEFFGMDAHAVIKKLQVDANVACDEEEINLGSLGTVRRRVPQSLAFGFMDETLFTERWRQICTHVGTRYFGMVDADAVVEMQKLMLAEQSA